MAGLPLVDDLKDLADYVHLSAGLLYRLSKYNDKFYKSFQLPKKSVGFRIISCPSKDMKAVQAWILRNILDRIHVTDSATGFRTGKNILDNAKYHEGNRYFLCLDIENFFPSIRYAKVYTVFKTIGYTTHISHIFASLCTCRGKLPQGGVTSPALSNIICIRLDHRISGYVGKRNVAYTRYADDMTFSCFLGPRRQRKVTGLIISDDSPGVGKKRKRILRATIHRLVTADLSEIERQRLRNHIDGWFAYMNSVDPKGFEQLKTYEERLSLACGGEDTIAEM
jgi:retron-type reverse transcriptase